MIIIHHSLLRHWLGILASIFLGMTFIVAGMGKWFASVKEFELLAFPDFLSQSVAETLFTWLPRVELTIGIVLIAGIAVKFVACLSLPLIIGFIVNNILLISMGSGREPCNCFGMGEKLSVFGSLHLDVVMVALVITVLVFHPGRFFNKRPWYW